MRDSLFHSSDVCEALKAKWCTWSKGHCDLPCKFSGLRRKVHLFAGPRNDSAEQIDEQRPPSAGSTSGVLAHTAAEQALFPSAIITASHFTQGEDWSRLCSTGCCRPAEWDLSGPEPASL